MAEDKKVKSEGFDPNKSKVSAETLTRFLENPISEDIKTVPGIGDKAAEKLAIKLETDDPVETTYQLIGKFLSLKGKGVSSKEHLDAFWFYLQQRGIDSHRAGIVDAIARKVDVMIPGIADY